MANQQFKPDRFDDLRKELEGKILTVDKKADEKVTNHVFYTILPLLVTILFAIFGYFFYQLNNEKEKNDSIKDRVIRIEAKMEIGKK